MTPPRAVAPSTRLAALSLVAAASFAVPGRAQVADSAAAARAHWRAASSALGAGDTSSALAAAQRATAAWPSQPAYLLGAARLAAASARPGPALDALERLARMGVGWREDDAAWRPLAGDARYATALATMRRATAPLARSVELARLRDTMLHPESVVRDEPRGRWLVSGVRGRTIVAVADDGVESRFPIPGATPLDAVLGLAIDAPRGLLWAVTAPLPQQSGWRAADSGRAALVAFALATGAERRRVRVADGLGGDVVVAPDGAVYAADAKGRLLVLPPGDSAPRVLSADPLLRSPQGMVVRPGHRDLLVADFSHGLLRVDLATGAAAAVPGPPEVTLLGLDGLVLLPDGRIAAMQNGIAPPRVLGLTLREDGRAVTRVEVLDRHLPLATEPTLGAVGAGHLVYVANSPWANYDEQGVPRAGAAWPRPLLLAVPLR